MTTDRRPEGAIVEWAVSGCALGGPGETNESGDIEVVAPFTGGVLIGVIDGLGHGAEAAHAACTAAEVLMEYAAEPVLDLVQRCHERLRHTRGAVMTLASLNGLESSITWAGVGNVEAVLMRADPTADSRHEAATARGGIVGFQLPPLRATALSVARGDTLIMATDGIRNGFTVGVNLHHSPREIAESILSLHSKGSDDSLVLVAQYLGINRD